MSTSRNSFNFVFYLATFIIFAIGAIVDYKLKTPEGLKLPDNFVTRDSFGGRAKYLTIINLVIYFFNF